MEVAISCERYRLDRRASIRSVSITNWKLCKYPSTSCIGDWRFCRSWPSHSYWCNCAGPLNKQVQQAFLSPQPLPSLSSGLLEHQRIVDALGKLRAAAHDAQLPEHENFANALILHAQTEELVLYPAAILVGELVAERLKGTV